MSLKKAKEDSLQFLQLIKSGEYKTNKKTSLPLSKLLNNYISQLNLKPNTIKDYQTISPHYLSNWMKKKVSAITKEMVEKRFYLIRDKGINGGIPTYSQATKAMRILSALMNYAMADDTIESNPVQVLKQKRIDRSIVKRTSYSSSHVN